MNIPNKSRAAGSELRSFVERIENLETEIKGLNSDKADIYGEAKSKGFDVKALRVVIARRRKDDSELSEHDALVETYEAALAPGTENATRVHARDRASGEPVKSRLQIALEGGDPYPDVPPYAPPDKAGPPDVPEFLDRRVEAAS